MKMNRLLMTLAAVGVFIAAIVCAPPAQAQVQYSVKFLSNLSSTTNSFPHESTNFFTTSFTNGTTDAILATSAGFMLKGKLNGSGTTAVTFELDESIDGSTWKTNVHRLIVTPAGTSEFSYTTNLTVNGVGYLRLGRIYNANTAAITNLQAKWSVKTGL